MTGAPLRVLHLDNHLVAVAKPACVPMVPDASGDDSLLDRVRRFVEAEFAKPGRAFVAVVHRLDRPVSGVALFARTSKAARRLTDAFRERRVEKVYWALCHGVPATAEGRVEQWLAKDRQRGVVRTCDGPREGAKLAVSRWRVLRRVELGRAEHGRVELGRGRGALVELRPETGRSHQLRVALASLGCPLVGDVKYGAPRPLDDRSVALHARRLAFEHPTRAERIELEDEPPDVPWWRLVRRAE